MGFYFNCQEKQITTTSRVIWSNSTAPKSIWIEKNKNTHIVVEQTTKGIFVYRNLKKKVEARRIRGWMAVNSFEFFPLLSSRRNARHRINRVHTYMKIFSGWLPIYDLKKRNYAIIERPGKTILFIRNTLVYHVTVNDDKCSGK